MGAHLDGGPTGPPGKPVRRWTHLYQRLTRTSCNTKASYSDDSQTIIPCIYSGGKIVTKPDKKDLNGIANTILQRCAQSNNYSVRTVADQGRVHREHSLP